MSVVVLVGDEGRAVFGDVRLHEFANHTAEVGRHEEGFKPSKFFAKKLLIHKAEEVDELIHRVMDLVNG